MANKTEVGDDIKDIVDKLREAVRRRFGMAADLDKVDVATVGGINRTVLFDLVEGAARRRLVLRQETYTTEYSPFLPPAKQWPLLEVAERHGVPLMIFVSGRPAEAAKLARAHPDLNLIIDHLGLKQPPRMVPDAEPFQQLPDLLALAQFPNVSVKVTGMPGLSREPWPWNDLWPHYARLIDAFGIERLIWGSDITRVAELMSYADALGYVKHTERLSASDKAKLLGGNLRRILDWHAPLGAER